MLCFNSAGAFVREIGRRWRRAQTAPEVDIRHRWKSLYRQCFDRLYIALRWRDGSVHRHIHRESARDANIGRSVRCRFAFDCVRQSLRRRRYELILVMRIRWRNGHSIGEFIASGSGGLDCPANLFFGPDGRLYVDNYDSILCYNSDGSNSLVSAAEPLDIYRRVPISVRGRRRSLRRCSRGSAI